MYLIRGELKVKVYSKRVVKLFNTVTLKSLSFVMFINDFSVHCNMYRALKGFYFTSACLLYKERRKLSNEFVLTFKLYEALIVNII